MVDYTPGRDLLNEIAASIKAAADVLQHSTDAALKAKAAVVKLEWEKAQSLSERVTAHSWGYRQTLDKQVDYARGTGVLSVTHPVFTGVWPEPVGPRIFTCQGCKGRNLITAKDHLDGADLCGACEERS